MITYEQKEYLKATILEKLILLDEVIKSLKEDTKPISPDNSIGRISRMDAINNKSVAEEALRKALDKYRGLKESLSMIDEEDFGKCQNCKKEINFKRISFMPEIRRCVKCAR